MSDKKVIDYMLIESVDLIINNVINKTNCSIEAKEIFLFCWQFTNVEINNTIAKLQSKKKAIENINFLEMILRHVLQTRLTSLFSYYLDNAITQKNYLPYTMDNETILSTELNYNYLNTSGTNRGKKQKHFFIAGMEKIQFAKALTKRIHELKARII